MIDLRGKVCRASNGSIGIPYEYRELAVGKFWIGIGFHGRFWRSRNPMLLANTLEEFIENNQNLRPWKKLDIKNDDTGCWNSPAKPFFSLRKPKPIWKPVELVLSPQEIILE